MRTFDDFAFAVRLACLDELGTGSVELEAVRLVSILDLPDLDVLQWNDAAGLLVRGVLEVVEAIVVEDEPAPLPALVASTYRGRRQGATQKRLAIDRSIRGADTTRSGSATRSRSFNYYLPAVSGRSAVGTKRHRIKNTNMVLDHIRYQTQNIKREREKKKSQR